MKGERLKQHDPLHVNGVLRILKAQYDKAPSDRRSIKQYFQGLAPPNEYLLSRFFCFFRGLFKILLLETRIMSQ